MSKLEKNLLTVAAAGISYQMFSDILLSVGLLMPEAISVMIWLDSVVWVIIVGLFICAVYYDKWRKK